MKNKKSFALLLCVLLLAAVLPFGVVAEESEDSRFEYRIVGGEAWITGYREKFLAAGESYDMVIPQAIEGCTVTRIEKEAFRDCRMRSVTVPDGVHTIGEGAFTGCSMESVSLPDSVTKIGASAFSACTKLKSIRIPDGVTEICENTFDGCGALTEALIPEGVTSIGRYAFSHCSALTSITIPESVEFIGDMAFCYCLSLKQVIIPKGVREIDYCAFCHCDELTDVYCEAVVKPDGWDEKWIAACEQAKVHWDSDKTIATMVVGTTGVWLAVVAVSLGVAAVIVLIVLLWVFKKRR